VDNELEVIRTQMEQTRSSLSDKLEALESEFRGTVEGATNAVETVQETVANVQESVKETVESVTEGVKETVATVKDALNVRKHVERHPWAMFGGAVLVGCLAGFFVGGRRKSRKSTPAVPEAPPEPPARNGSGYRNGVSRKAAEAAPEAESGIFSGLKALKGLAVGTLMSTLRDVIVEAVPSNLSSDVARVVDDMTTKLGGKPLRREEGADENDTENEGGTPHGESGTAEVGSPMGASRWSR